ncbi:hypothetical protein DdX_15184 [Ditylenchus destructor]|uniref:Uncharacterized protein n=1 Tax=Ditylenchus destructor TaxID=166010 RepID=A0AAD4MQU5_9BILA|nr:hypothetical protein DdX_15184 [Ditylenchus destructor]
MSAVHRCAACAKKNKEMLFVNIDCLLSHIRKNHVDNAPRYPCPVCRKLFLTEQRLARHLLYSDPIQNATQCGKYMPPSEREKASDSVLAYEIMELSVQELIRANKTMKEGIGADDFTENVTNKAPDATANATDKRANRSPESPIPPEPSSTRSQVYETTPAPPKAMTMVTEIAAASQVPSTSHQEISTAEDNEQNIRNQELQRAPAPQNNTTMVTEIVAPSEVQSTSRQEMSRAENEEQNRAIQSLLSFGDYDDPDNWLNFDMTDTTGSMIAAPVNEDFGFEQQDVSYLNLNPPLSDALVQQIENNNNLMAEAQNQENLQLHKENTPPPISASTAGPSNAGNAFQIPKIVIAPPKNLQMTPKAGPSNKSILVADRPALNERSAEKKVRFISGDTVEKVKKKVAAKHKIDSDEESSSSDSDSSNSSQASGSSSSSSSSSSPPRSPSPQFEQAIPPVFTRPQTARPGRKRTINRESTRRGLKRAIQEPSPKYNTRLRTRERGDHYACDHYALI